MLHESFHINCSTLSRRWLTFRLGKELRNWKRGFASSFHNLLLGSRLWNPNVLICPALHRLDVFLISSIDRNSPTCNLCTSQADLNGYRIHLAILLDFLPRRGAFWMFHIIGEWHEKSFTSPPNDTAMSWIGRENDGFLIFPIFTSPNESTQWISGCFLIYSSLMPCDILNFFFRLQFLRNHYGIKEKKKKGGKRSIKDSGRYGGRGREMRDEQLLSRVFIFLI